MEDIFILETQVTFMLALHSLKQMEFIQTEVPLPSPVLWNEAGQTLSC